MLFLRMSHTNLVFIVMILLLCPQTTHVRPAMVPSEKKL